MFRLKDRRDNDYMLGPTHEELFTLTVKGEYSSYKDFPLLLYQIQTKFRDEARPRAGILRGREFVMKDSYSFDVDEAGLKDHYHAHREAYQRIFNRLDVQYVIVSAVSGAMGGSASEEFLAESPIGEDTFVRCIESGYAANVEAVDHRPARPAAVRQPAGTGGARHRRHPDDQHAGRVGELGGARSRGDGCRHVEERDAHGPYPGRGDRAVGGRNSRGSRDR